MASREEIIKKRGLRYFIIVKGDYLRCTYVENVFFKVKKSPTQVALLAEVDDGHGSLAEMDEVVEITKEDYDLSIDCSDEDYESVLEQLFQKYKDCKPYSETQLKS
jgi:hypothetical protein